jgi:hypothetical protein
MPTVLRDLLAKDLTQTGSYQEQLLRHQRGIPIPVPDPLKNWAPNGYTSEVFDSIATYPKWETFYEGPPRFKYSSYVASGTKDLFVWQALRRFDPEMASLLRNTTRRPGGLKGMYRGLQKFDERAPDPYALRGEELDAFNLAVEQTKSDFRLDAPANVITLAEAHDRGMERSSAAGYSFPGFKKGEVMAEILVNAKHVEKQWLNTRPTKLAFRRHKFPPCTVAQRGGPSVVGEEKTRLVWVYPAEVVACEMRVALPLYDAYTKRPCRPMLYGNNPDAMMNDWFTKTTKGTFTGMDISTFDASIAERCLDIAVNQVVAENITFVDPKVYRNLRRDRDRNRYLEACAIRRQRYLFGIFHYLCFTPVLMPDGRFIIKCQGMPSGSAFTQLVDSIVNCMYVHFAANMQHAKIEHLIVLGDDSGFESKTFDIVKASEDLNRCLGITIHPDKCNFSPVAKEFVMLGYSYNGCRRKRETGDWFLMALCPERRVTDIATSFGRLFGIFLAGGKQDYHYCKFMSYYQQGYDVPSEVKIPRQLVVLLRRGMGLEVLPFEKLSRDRTFAISKLS